MAALGPPVTTPLIRLDVAIPTSRIANQQRILTGVVINVDHFGNLRTNIDRDHIGSVSPGDCKVSIDGTEIGPIANCYADRTPGDMLALFGSNNRLEIAVSQGSAAVRFPTARIVSITIPADKTEPGT